MLRLQSLRSSSSSSSSAAAADVQQPRHGPPVVVGNPTKDLYYADAEAVEVGRMLGVVPLVKEQASRPVVLRRMSSSSHIHLTCHSSWEQKSFFMSPPSGGMGGGDLGGGPPCDAVTCDNCGDEEVSGIWHRCDTCLYRMDGVQGYSNPIPPPLWRMPTLCGRCFKEKERFHEKGHSWISVQPITMRDVARLGALKANVAVLNCCYSGWGDVQGDEGVVGVSRSFITGGVPSVVGTLWSVFDNTSGEIMLKFYEHLLGRTGQGLCPAVLQPQNSAAAWRLAVMSWMQDPDVRYYASTTTPIKEWSAFQVIGLPSWFAAGAAEHSHEHLTGSKGMRRAAM
jgi:hypothetical protein